ncbi:DUF1822 family protein, partial [Leptolyngbya sp. FACHB-36]|uniref:DUF1822 family protein n=1 Tax=Leptolyngbya sp. FACHB-36 TaxID=2692808 RepID=UPI0016811F43
IEVGDRVVWELLDGSAVTLGSRRLVLIPTEAMDRSEFRVPQEWIDIPAWVADYYLAVEVDADEQRLHIWGYTTHETLKTSGSYDANDRTYCLDGSRLIDDMTVFWVMQQLAPEPTRVAVPSVAALSQVQAEELIQRLAPSIDLPRLQVPFEQWAGLLLQPAWRQRLTEHRQGQRMEDRSQPLVNLSQWLQEVFDAGWQAMETIVSPASLAFNFRRDDDVPPSIRRVKRIQLGGELPDVLLVVALAIESDSRRRIWVQLLPQERGATLPETLQLSLLSPTGDVLQSVQAGSDSSYIQLRRFKCAPGTQFRLGVAIADVSVMEAFVS